MTNLAIRGGTPVRDKPWTGWPVYDDRDKQALLETLESGEWGIGSPAIERFEREFASFCRAKQAISCTNGTDAIYIALQAMAVGPGDEVIIPPYTFIATAIGVLMAGATPVFADIHPETYNLDPWSVRQAITSRTRAIIPVHIAGNPADMDEFLSIAHDHNVLIMEDAAQAHGAQWRGVPVGALGNLGTFSFQSSKNLAAGEGGALVTNDECLAERARTFVNCGRVKGGAWYDHHEMAGNHRLGAFQAALLSVGLQRIEEQTQTRERNAQYLAENVRNIEGVDLTKTHEGCTRNAHHLCILRYRSEAFKDLPKTRFVEAMQKEGIDCASGYLPLYRYHYFQHFAEKTPTYKALYRDLVDYSATHCPVAERASAEEGVWLFQDALLGDRQDMDDILEAIRKVQRYAEEAM